MNFSIKNIIAAVVLSLAVLTGCEGPVGPAGPEGAAGANGADGAEGASGPDGANGVGIDELITMGSISVTFSGTIPEDSVPFETTMVYPFASTMDIGYNSGTFISENHRYFYVARWFSAPSYENVQENDIGFYLDVNEAAEPDTVYECAFFAFTRIIENTKYFNIYTEYYFPPESVSDYSYNAETGAFSFHFDFVIPGDDNSTGFDLTVSGDAEVLVLESLLPLGP